MQPRYFNRATSLIGFAPIASECGADLTHAMQTVNLDPVLLSRPEEKVPFDRLSALFEYCADAWRLPDLGLRLARYQHMEILGPVALVTKMEPDLRSAMRAMTENLMVHTTATTAVLQEAGDVAMLSLDAVPVPAGVRQYLMTSVGVAWNVLEQAGNAKIDLFEVTFRSAEGSVRAAAEAHFRCPVRFNAEHNALFFARSVLDKPIERNDTAYHAIIRRYLSTTRDEVAGRTSDAVSAEIARQMEFGVCTFESVAQKLRIEPRSLQRKLQKEGVAFRELVDAWRKARALSLVAHTRLPLAEVSLAMGYTDQSIFSRAFQRWYGEAPLACRNRSAG